MFYGNANEKPCSAEENDEENRKRKTHILTTLLDDAIEENGQIFFERFAEDPIDGTDFDLAVIELFKQLGKTRDTYLAKLPK